MSTATDWIEHDGKGMPVDWHTLTQAKLRSGSQIGPLPALRLHTQFIGHSYWYWDDDHSDYDIIAYRVVSK